MTRRPDARVIGILRDRGLRPTRQRMALAELLFRGGDCHTTAEELHARTRALDAEVSLATVYNTLHQFTAAGLLREVGPMGGPGGGSAGRTCFDTNTAHHHHFYLEETGELVDVPEEQVAIAALPEAPEGTRLTRVDVVMRLTRAGGTEKTRRRRRRTP